MLRGPGFAVTFLYYFSTTTLIIAFLVAQKANVNFLSPANFQMGIVVGTLVGLVAAYFNHNITIEFEFKKKHTFTTKLNQALSKMGFDEQRQVEDFVVYYKSGVKKLFSGKISIKIEKKSARIMGRSSQVKQLRQNIKLLTEVREKAQGEGLKV